MIKELEVALIGLDTSHTIEFARRMQSPDCAPEQRVVGMRAVTCLRFETPFQDEEGLNKRQEQLEQWGVKVTTDFEEAVANCDAIMLEINDPAYHLEYFTKCADLGKPIFLDKPLADTIENGRKIYELAKEKNVRVFSASSLRFVPQLIEACKTIPVPKFVTVYGPLGKAPAGSSIVWYGVHAFEMLERAMGRGAIAVTARRDGAGVVAIVDYPEGVRGVVELNEGSWIYGGCLRTKDKAEPFVVNMARAYSDELELVGKFFQGGDVPVEMEDTLEVMAMLDAAERSVQSGKTESVQV
ncbi:MAG: Gfo/Idh/MocA family oxidoreductase [Armatimonadota bacterium]|nr:Gfo/Idh/MocA family oxidoreductase [Armatimonadota bacterium]